MQISPIVFYIFSMLIILASIKVITARNPVHAAMSLVLTFFITSCLWITLEAEFLAIALVLVYVGAVMVLFIFVVMMLDINVEKEKKRFSSWLAPGIILLGAMFVGHWLLSSDYRLVLEGFYFPEPKEVGYSNTKELGRLIYTEYVYAFEIAAVILLVAIVAAIALTLRVRENKRTINVGDQVAADSSTRIKMISDLSESKQETQSKENR